MQTPSTSADQATQPSQAASAPVKETPFFFHSGSHALFGLLHEPPAGRTGDTFVFCHPFGEEKLWSHRVYVSFARTLADAGHAVLRFDYMGNGDSDGLFEHSTLTTAQADVRAAIEQARQLTGAERVHLLGLRLGATIASLVAEQSSDVDRLILWSPIVDGARYMQELLRINLTTQMAMYKEVRQDREALVAIMEGGDTVNVDGYELSHRHYSEVSAVKLAAGPKRHMGPCLVVHIDRQPGRPAGELQQLADTYSHGSLVFAQEEAFWKEIAKFYHVAPNLYATTTAFVA